MNIENFTKPLYQVFPTDLFENNFLSFFYIAALKYELNFF